MSLALCSPSSQGISFDDREINIGSKYNKDNFKKIHSTIDTFDKWWNMVNDLTKNEEKERREDRTEYRGDDGKLERA